MNELKPCPFCGGKAVWDCVGGNFNYTDVNGKPKSIGLFYTIKCQNIICGCGIGMHESTKTAIEAWNRRNEGVTK